MFGVNGWGAHPTNLQRYLNGLPNKATSIPNLTFYLVISDTKSAISHWVAYTLRKERPAPMVLVEGDDHWVLVEEYTLKEEPAADSPTTKYKIDRFFIADPSVNYDPDR